MRSWREALADQLDPRVAGILFLGFSSGLPLLLVGSTLAAWLAEEGIDNTTIGFTAIVGIAYTIKFLWTPLIDRLEIPLLGRLMGRRRSWLLVSQVGVAGALFGLGQCRPGVDFFPALLWACLVAYLSATQDMVIDAYRIEILKTEQLGAGAANVTLGYRIGMLVAGGGCLLIADQLDWHAAYSVMALLMMLGVVATLLIQEPAVGAARTQLDFKSGVIEPFLDYMRRPGWLMILVFIILYRYSDALIGNMANPFYIKLGFTKTQVGLVSKFYGTMLTAVGALLGGVLYSRLGLARSLMLAGIAQAASNLLYVGLALEGPSVSFLTLTISIENFASGFATVVFVAYLSSLCSVAYTATQYALLSAASSVARTFLASIAGWVVDQVSWPLFFVFSTLAGLPCLFLLVVLMRRYPPDQAAAISGRA